MRVFVLAFSAALLAAVATGVARAEEPAVAPAPPHQHGLADQSITYGELFAIGSGAVVGTTLAAAVIDHGLGFVGTLLGAWAGDYYYFRYFTGATHPSAVAAP